MNKLIYPPEKAATSLDEKASKLSKSSNENVHVVVIYVSLRKINADWHGDKSFDRLSRSNQLIVGHDG